MCGGGWGRASDGGPDAARVGRGSIIKHFERRCTWLRALSEASHGICTCCLSTLELSPHTLLTHHVTHTRLISHGAPSDFMCLASARTRTQSEMTHFAAALDSIDEMSCAERHAPARTGPKADRPEKWCPPTSHNAMHHASQLQTSFGDAGIYEDTAARQVSPPGTAIVDPSPQVGAAAEKRVVKKAGVRFFGEREKKVDAHPLACSATAHSHLPAVQQTTSIRAVTHVRENTNACLACSQLLFGWAVRTTSCFFCHFNHHNCRWRKRHS